MLYGVLEQVRDSFKHRGLDALQQRGQDPLLRAQGAQESAATVAHAASRLARASERQGAALARHADGEAVQLHQAARKSFETAALVLDRLGAQSASGVKYVLTGCHDMKHSASSWCCC